MARQFEIARWNKPLNWNFLSQILSAAYITYILHIWVYSTWMSDTAIYIYFAQFRLTFSALVFRFSLRDFSRCQNKIDNLLSFNVRESSFSIFFVLVFLLLLLLLFGGGIRRLCLPINLNAFMAVTAEQIHFQNELWVCVFPSVCCFFCIQLYRFFLLFFQSVVVIKKASGLWTW